MSDDRAQPNDQREPRSRTRIPRSEWPAIVARHRGGESPSDIAQSYGTTPTSISNIIRQAEAAQTPSEDPSPEPRPAETPPERPRTTLRSPSAPPRAPEPAPAPEKDRDVPSVEDRVREGSEQLVAAYVQWRERRDGATASELQQALHELRKALARVEIDIAAGRPSDLAQAEGQARRPRGRH